MRRSRNRWIPDKTAHGNLKNLDIDSTGSKKTDITRIWFIVFLFLKLILLVLTLHLFSFFLFRDVYARLKLLEDRILLLESLSPEYSLISPETFKPNSLLSSRSNPEKSEFWSHNRPNSETGEGRNRSKLSQLSAVISFSGQIKQVILQKSTSILSAITCK